MFLLAKCFRFLEKHLLHVAFVLHIYRGFIQKFSYNSMDFKYHSENNTMLYIVPYALILHNFSSKAIEENLGKVKGSALHEMIQDELVSFRRKVL